MLHLSPTLTKHPLCRRPSERLQAKFETFIIKVVIKREVIIVSRAPVIGSILSIHWRHFTKIYSSKLFVPSLSISRTFSCTKWRRQPDHNPDMPILGPSSSRIRLQNKYYGIIVSLFLFSYFSSLHSLTLQVDTLHFH